MAIEIEKLISLDITAYLEWHKTGVHFDEKGFLEVNKNLADLRELARKLGSTEYLFQDITRSEWIAMYSKSEKERRENHAMPEVYPVAVSKVMDNESLQELDRYRQVCFDSDVETLETKCRFRTDRQMVVDEFLNEIAKNRDVWISGYIASCLPLPKVDHSGIWDFAQQLATIEFLQFLLTEKQNVKPSALQSIRLPEKIMLLHELGFFGLDKLVELQTATGKRDLLVSLLLGENQNNTKKNINALKTPTATFNPHQHKGILDRLLTEEKD